LHGARNGIGIRDVGSDNLDLSDISHRQKEIGEVGTAHADADAIAGAGQCAHHVAAEEPRTAENGDKRGHEKSNLELVGAVLAPTRPVRKARMFSLRSSYPTLVMARRRAGHPGETALSTYQARRRALA